MCRPPPSLLPCLGLALLSFAPAGCGGANGAGSDPAGAEASGGSPDAGGGDGAGGSDAGGGGLILPGVELCPTLDEGPLPWPAPPPQPPPCDPLFDTFALPAVAGNTGAIELFPSAPLQPLGHHEAIDVKVRVKAGGKTDEKAKGVVALQLPQGVALISMTPLVKGRAVAVVRVDEPGPHVISASLPGDGRVGSVGLYGYKTRLPVYEVEIAPGDLGAILDEPSEYIWKKATLTVQGVAASGKMRLHGGSSRMHPKKSFRFNLDDLKGIGGRRKIVLRAEWSDRTLLRNWLGLEVFRYGTWLPVSKARFVHLRINRRYYGVMLDVERIDKAFLRARGMSDQGSLYEADPPSEKTLPGGNLTPLAGKAEYPLVYQHHAGAVEYTDLIALVEVVLKLADAPLKAALNRVVRVDDVLVYLAAMAVIQNRDHVRKNYYLYRDPQAEDCRWAFIPWDLDLALGRLWTEEHDILDDKLFTDGDIWTGTYQGHSFYNQLIDRVLTLEPWRSRYLKFVGQLLVQPFTEAFFQQRIEAAICEMQPDLLADARKRSDNDDLPGRVAELHTFVKARRAFLQAAIQAAAEAGP